MSQRKDGKPNWDEVLMQGICQGPQIGRVVPGGQHSVMRLKGNVEARRHPQNKRAGQGRVAKSWLL